MGIIKWFNDRWNKPVEKAAKPIVDDKTYSGGVQSIFDPNFKKHIPSPPEPVLSDIDRVTNYFASGGEIVDISNKPRKDNDGFPPDHELMTPFNEAHLGTKAGLSSMVGRKK